MKVHFIIGVALLILLTTITINQKIIITKLQKSKKKKEAQEKKAKISPKIKAILAKYKVKGSLAVRNHMTLCLNLKSGSIDFGTDRINEYWYKDHFADNPKALAFLSEVIPAMNIGNFDKSDVQTDYFHVGWYMSVNLGKWDKPYILNN